MGLSEASKIRADEKASFTAAESELVETVDMLGRAKSVLERELAFIQGPKSGPMSKSGLKEKLSPMLNGLQAILNAAWVSDANKKSLTAFLSEGEDNAEDLSLVQVEQQQPQAAV